MNRRSKLFFRHTDIEYNAMMGSAKIRVLVGDQTWGNKTYQSSMGKTTSLTSNA